METRTTRQERLLELIVRQYVEVPRKNGVSSQRLVEKYGLDWSSAAGRIPTEAGYRYFVSRLVDNDSLKSAGSAA